MVGSVTIGCSRDALTDRTERDESGSIVGSGSVGTARLRVGDCFDEPAATTVEVVTGVPCDDPHDGQVVSRVVIEGSEPWPGTEELVEAAGASCAAAGASAASALAGVDGAPEVGLSAYVPDAPAWADGDRDVICWLEAREEGQLFGDLVPESEP